MLISKLSYKLALEIIMQLSFPFSEFDMLP